MERFRLLLTGLLLGVLVAMSAAAPAAAVPKWGTLETTCGDQTYDFVMTGMVLLDTKSNMRYLIKRWHITPPMVDNQGVPILDADGNYQYVAEPISIFDNGFEGASQECTATCPRGYRIKWWGFMTPAKAR
jgi:hypothetical protein